MTESKARQVIRDAEVVHQRLRRMRKGMNILESTGREVIERLNDADFEVWKARRAVQRELLSIGR